MRQRRRLSFLRFPFLSRGSRLNTLDIRICTLDFLLLTLDLRLYTLGIRLTSLRLSLSTLDFLLSTLNIFLYTPDFLFSTLAWPAVLVLNHQSLQLLHSFPWPPSVQ